MIVTLHYGAEPSFTKYIATIDRAGFDQLVSPGANNWNEIYDDLDAAYANEAQFLADAKAARSPHVLGMFETVWHDDGESLYEATWAPVVFAAASAWQATPVDRATLASHVRAGVLRQRRRAVLRPTSTTSPRSARRCR